MDTMTTHIPGPWIFRTAGQSVYIAQDGYMPHACVFNRGVTSGQGQDLTDDDRGNARLIAASPDLLAACEAMLAAQSARRHPLGAPDEGIATMCVEAASKARAAIAKATGTHAETMKAEATERQAYPFTLKVF
jgi:hypothetical protein